MKCPVCSAEIADNAVKCPACQAFQTVVRTPLGVLAGWIGIISSVLTAMLLVPVPLMAFFGVSLKDYPWILPIIGLTLATVSFGYSRTTRHAMWLEHKEIR